MTFSTKKRLFLLGFFVLIAIAIPLTISQLQFRQEERSRATASTTLSLKPDSTPSAPIQKNVGEAIALDMMVDPGNNLVTFVKFQVKYDPTKLELLADPFTINVASFPVKVEGPVKGTDTVAEALSIGADTTKAIQVPTKVGTFNFKAKGSTGGSPTVVTFTTITQVLSSAPGDQASENVLSTSIPANINIAAVVASPTVTPTPKPPTTTPSPNPTATSTPTPSSCQSKRYSTVFSGAKEVPANNSSATGKITIGLATTPGYANSITETVNLQLNQVTAMHIHSPADPNTTAPAQVTLFNGPAGSFTNPYTKNLFILPANVLTDIDAGKAYVNIHTNQYPNGEIRGQLECDLTQPTVTPQQPTPTSIPNTPTSIPTLTTVPPTPTAIPTPTTIPNTTVITFDLLLHGVGAAGDNPNPKGNSLSNKNPLHPQRNIVVQIIDSNNQIVSSTSGAVVYNSVDGTFVGQLDLGQTFATGNYILKVKSDRYLRRIIPGVQTITSNQNNKLPQAGLVAGDVNGDNALNVLDYNALLDCGYGALNPLPIIDPNSAFNSQACQIHTPSINIDVDDNGIVNSFDYNLFLRELSVRNGD